MQPVFVMFEEGTAIYAVKVEWGRPQGETVLCQALRKKNKGLVRGDTNNAGQEVVREDTKHGYWNTIIIEL